MKPFRVPAFFGRILPAMKEKRTTAFLIAGLVVLALIFFSLWLGAKRQLDDPEELANRDARAVAQKVGDLMVLPDEEPTVATITDASRLTNQAFFARAKNGDRVLFFNEERLVILYDPVANKIVNVGSVAAGSSPSASFTQPGIQKAE